MKTDSSTTWIGIDLGDRKHTVCVLGAGGEIIRECFITNSRCSLERLSEACTAQLSAMKNVLAALVLYAILST